MRITKISINRFRGFHNESFELGSQLTAIAGQNGTQKSTLLGIITQTFTLKKGDPMRNEKPLCGGSYISAFSDKFRLSPMFDKPKEHEWTLSFDDGQDDFTVESIRRHGYDTVRFWKKGARREGDGYLPFPTIFLSLKRLVPVAEEVNVQTDDSFLTNEELNEFKTLHNKILLVQAPISSATAISSKNKQSLGVSTNLYDWNQNSMGQDNLSKIILALFSFKRLKEKYQDYKGGILAIDELDATMFPASQEKLLNVLRKYASRLNLQIFFTTHSLSLLEATDALVKETSVRAETSNQVKIIYLKRMNDRIEIKQDVDFKDILLNLNVIAERASNDRKKGIVTYTEDKENMLFVKAILKTKSTVLNFVDIPMPCSFLIELVKKKVPAFSRPYSIVILDGDIRGDRSQYKKIQGADNVLLLPGTESPERMIANYLNGLSDEDNLWPTVANGYTKQVCFKDISLEEIRSDREKAKKWLNSQLPLWGRNGFKVLNPFFASIQQDVDSFKTKFENMFKKFI